jgi:membrane protein DedA with SNARE-associated domain
MPYYWAGLVLVGDVDPVQRPFWHRHRWWVLAALVLVVVGAAVWWRRR